MPSVQNTRRIFSKVSSRFVHDVHEPYDWEFDIMLTDVKLDDLRFISNKLGHEYLSPSDNDASLPLNGFIYGTDTMRPFVILVVGRAGKRVNVPFIVDSGCPGVYISEDVFSALGFSDSIPPHTVVNLHGFDSFNVSLSPTDSNFAGVSVLGQKFFKETKLVKYENTAEGKICIARSLADVVSES